MAEPCGARGCRHQIRGLRTACGGLLVHRASTRDTGGETLTVVALVACVTTRVPTPGAFRRVPLVRARGMWWSVLWCPALCPQSKRREAAEEQRRLLVRAVSCCGVACLIVAC